MKKKILIMGSAALHNKLILEAKEMGLYSVVTDNIPYSLSAGKKIADEYWDIDVCDVDRIVKKCRENNISAVISGWLDPCQKPYGEVCARLGLPAYATPEMFDIMTNKLAFKQLCIRNGLDVIHGYSEEEAYEQIRKEALYVKPTDSRGSRGQKVCHDRESLMRAVQEARLESQDGNVIIEQYVTGCSEIHLTYFVVDGEPYLNRTADVFTCTGKEESRKVISAGTFPSVYTEHYITSTHPRVVNLIKELGIQYGPVYLQGFCDNGVFRFFDQGLRFAGTNVELASKKSSGVNLTRAMIEIAMTGKTAIVPKGNTRLNGKMCMVLYMIGAGDSCLAEVRGIDSILKNKHVVSFIPRKEIGDSIIWSYDVNQYLAELVLIADNLKELTDTVDYVHEKYRALDENGRDIIIERFDHNRIRSK